MAVAAEINLHGNLARDPDLSFTKDGKPIANFTVVTSERFLNRDTNQWEDRDVSFWNCSAFGPLAENICESCEKGTAVIVTGRVKIENWVDKEGQKRQSAKVSADDVAVSLKFRKASVTHNNGSRQEEQVPF